MDVPKIIKVSGVTLKVSSMRRSIGFYRDLLGLDLLYGGEEASFSSFSVDGTYVNLELSRGVKTDWGRIISYCEDVDKIHSYLKGKGYDVAEPMDASWGERFFHMKDPDGHGISIAKPLGNRGQAIKDSI